MRLWHQALLPYLDRKRLLAQHRECCALRGKGWGKKHSVVDYVFKYNLDHLYAYHSLVLSEIAKLNYHIDPIWYLRTYRGKHLPMSDLRGKHLPTSDLAEVGTFVYSTSRNTPIYKEHDDNYLRECLLNLKSKVAELEHGKAIDAWLVELDLKENCV